MRCCWRLKVWFGVLLDGIVTQDSPAEDKPLPGTRSGWLGAGGAPIPECPKRVTRLTGTARAGALLRSHGTRSLSIDRHPARLVRRRSSRQPSEASVEQRSAPPRSDDAACRRGTAGIAAFGPAREETRAGPGCGAWPSRTGTLNGPRAKRLGRPARPIVARRSRACV